MRYQKLISLTFAALAMGQVAAVQAAGQITGIQASASTAVLQDGKATIRFTVNGNADDSDNCGIYVQYGDGDSPDTRIINQKEGLFPRTFEHTFTKPGGFSVKAVGQRVRQTFGCNGEATTFVTITEPAAQKGGPAGKGAGKAAAAAPSCPEGWTLAGNTYNKATGEFSCNAKPPAAKMACGPGLVYYEKGSTIGCRRGR